VANHFNGYFTSVADEIFAEIPQIGGDDILNDPTENEVLNIINCLKNTTFTEIPTAIMKTFNQHLH
jgi:hypothetical protein